MRVVEKEDDFESQMNRAISEAVNAFGDGSVFIEKYVASPRHIEIQIMADTHGNVFIYLNANVVFNVVIKKWLKKHHHLY